jgi:phenylacetic acid degradation operon negative regulatory protein
MRTALSRMLTSGEVLADDGWYSLGDRLQRRQATLDAARHLASEPWDGAWWFAIVGAERRSHPSRRTFRALMQEHRMGELRPEVWLRPANLPGPPSLDGVVIVRGTVDADPADLAAQLWDLDGLVATSDELTELVGEALQWLEPGNPAVLHDTFLLSVAVVRFLAAEPHLPGLLVGGTWPPDALRTAYDRLEAAHGAVLATFLRGAGDAERAAITALDRSERVM